ncbi:MAG: hypothetical protein HON76_03580 [Candidatus Scalindua sp.]|jgi:hypothetical protein|nr:hypothetical protein [Candidatus Scalindua sp.]MBT5304708.1 hypothetical protein [Candidatus Scalindua sp.]MBT6230802.1 hypothetical protein [Candidatus Scalindua sp.]MBT6561589.1 hypothetical protein [Candidatus Scalindua sp.]MBT7212016.1 hypothetical protein [Candidatus Scalindua sp.]
MLIRTLLIAITFIWLGAGMVGCVTNPQVLKEQKSEEARAAIETVDRQADAILAQAKKDLAVAKVLLKKDEHADTKAKGVPIRNLAHVYYNRAIQLRLMTVRYMQYTFAADDIAKQHADPEKQALWTQCAAEYSQTAWRLHQLALHHADLAAHPEKIADELLPDSP